MALIDERHSLEAEISDCLSRLQKAKAISIANSSQFDKKTFINARQDPEELTEFNI